MSPTGVIQPPAHVPTVASPQNSVASPNITTMSPTGVIQPPAHVPTVASPQNSIASPNITTMSPTGIIQPPAHVPTVASPQNTVAFSNITAPNPNEASFLFPQTSIPNSGFAPNLTQTNSQQSLMALMSEPLHSWPNQDQQGLGDRDLFDFLGLESFSGSNTFNSDTSFYWPDMALANGNNLLNGNTPANINSLSHPVAAPLANIDTLAAANLNVLNGNTLPNTNTLSHPLAAPVANIDTPADANTLLVANIASTPSLNQNKGNNSRKRKSDEADLVLPDGSRRVRKKKCRPDENVSVPMKRGKKK
jgi:hypothetical protein